MKKLLIVDLDTGVDDAQAIMMVLANPNVEVLGFTCCNGNIDLKNVCLNTLRVLKLCNRLDIPVYGGSSEPLLGQRIPPEYYYGKDGLGDVPDPDAPGLDLLQKEGAVDAMIRMVNEHPGEVTLVAIAPLTNVALAVKLDPSLPKKLKGLYLMGGNINSRGNTTVCGEFNFVTDAEAAYIVLNRFSSCPIYIATWEFACENSLPWSFCKTWLAQDTEKARFMKKVCIHMVEGQDYIMCDPYAMAAAIEDHFVTESEQVAVTVELDGTNTRGMMVLDYNKKLKEEHVVNIIKKVDVDMFKKMLMDALK